MYSEKEISIQVLCVAKWENKLDFTPSFSYISGKSQGYFFSWCKCTGKIYMSPASLFLSARDITPYPRPEERQTPSQAVCDIDVMCIALRFYTHPFCKSKGWLLLAKSVFYYPCLKNHNNVSLSVPRQPGTLHDQPSIKAKTEKERKRRAYGKPSVEQPVPACFLPLNLDIGLKTGKAMRFLQLFRHARIFFSSWFYTTKINATPDPQWQELGAVYTKYKWDISFITVKAMIVGNSRV